MTVKMVIDGKEVEYDTVEDMIALLQTLPKDLLIVMAKDPEGNGYSPWAGYYQGRYEATCTWAGEIRDPDEKERDGSFYHDDDERKRIEALPQCLVLWPVN